MKKLFPALILFFLVFSYAFVFAVPGAWATCNCKCQDNNNPGSVAAQPPTTNTDQDECQRMCNLHSPASAMTSCQVATQAATQNAAGSGQVVLTDPLSLYGDPTKFFGRLIGALLAFVGVASLITFVYAGFMFLTSTGNQEQVKKAKDTMIYAVIGAAVSMGSYAILSYVFDILQSSTK